MIEDDPSVQIWWRLPNGNATQTPTPAMVAEFHRNFRRLRLKKLPMKVARRIAHSWSTIWRGCDCLDEGVL